MFSSSDLGKRSAWKDFINCKGSWVSVAIKSFLDILKVWRTQYTDHMYLI